MKEQKLFECPKGYDKHSWKGPGVYKILGEKTIHPRNGNKPFKVTQMKRMGDIIETQESWVGRQGTYEVRFRITGKIDSRGNQNQWLSDKTIFVDEDEIRKVAEKEGDDKFAPQIRSFFQGFYKQEEKKADLRYFEYQRYAHKPTYKTIEGRYDRFGPLSGEDRSEISGWEVKLVTEEIDLKEEMEIDFHLEKMEEEEYLIKGKKYTLPKEVIERNKAVKAKVLESLQIVEDYYSACRKAREEFFKNPPKEYSEFVRNRTEELTLYLKEKAEKSLQEVEGEWV